MLRQANNTEVAADLRRRGFSGRYRVRWNQPRLEGDWFLLGQGRCTVEDGVWKGTIYSPHSASAMDFWTSKTQALRAVAASGEFSSLVVEHNGCSEAWGHVENSEFEAFAKRLGIRTRKPARVMPSGRPFQKAPLAK